VILVGCDESRITGGFLGSRTLAKTAPAGREKTEHHWFQNTNAMNAHIGPPGRTSFAGRLWQDSALARDEAKSLSLSMRVTLMILRGQLRLKPRYDASALPIVRPEVFLWLSSVVRVVIVSRRDA
jgi:hypothetical protein